MRMLFTTLPGAGPLHPLVPLARALEEAGHEVAFATSRSYCPTVESTGFNCFPAGYDWLVGEREPLYARVRELLAGREAPFSPLEDVYTAFLPPRMVPDLLSLARSWEPDVLVRDPMEFAGCVAAEVLGIPHAACGPLFSFWQGAWHGVPGEVGKPKLNELRRAHGLPPDPDSIILHRYLYLAFLPPTFLDPGLMHPPPRIFYARSVPISPALRCYPLAHAPAGASYGTRQPGNRVPPYPGRLYGYCREVARRRDQPDPRRGARPGPAAFGPQPSNVYIERYIPHTLLLPHCDAVVTHGGFSSVMACFEEGLPMVAIPLAGGDQAGNARRCAALGVARVVAPDERTPEVIREAVLDVLREPRYRKNAEHLRQEIQALPEPEHAVELLERLALEKVPLAATSQRMQRRYEEV